jgi:hypothetical protein
MKHYRPLEEAAQTQVESDEEEEESEAPAVTEPAVILETVPVDMTPAQPISTGSALQTPPSASSTGD